MLVMQRAVDTAVAKARQSGVGLVGARNGSATSGALGYYLEAIAQNGWVQRESSPQPFNPQSGHRHFTLLSERRGTRIALATDPPPMDPTSLRKYPTLTPPPTLSLTPAACSSVWSSHIPNPNPNPTLNPNSNPNLTPTSCGRRIGLVFARI